MQALDSRILETTKRALTDAKNSTAIQDDMRSLLSQKLQMREDEIIEVERVVSLLDNGMLFAAFTFAMPVSIVTNFIFCKLAKRTFKLNISHVVEMAAFITVVIWYSKYDEFMKVDNEGFSLQENPTRA
jgi:hypothetical protein